MSAPFQIHQYPFDDQLEFTLLDQQVDYLYWPIVYFLKDWKLKEAYVGETTDMLSRLKTHLKHPRKQKLASVSLVRSELFNKSATLDMEALLIRYIAADGEFNLQNGNLGISNHQYYQQNEVYRNLFRDVWDELRAMGIARHSLHHIDNSDLFKYSPYKSLSREQMQGLKTILFCLLDDDAKVSLIHGGAGTGKSILAIFLFKLLKTDLSDFNRADFDEDDEEMFRLVEQVRRKYGHLEMALVIPMASFRKTISKVFKNIQGLSSSMVIGPAEVANKRYDLLIVDEGHRLRQRRNLASYFGTFDKVATQLGMDSATSSELDWVLMQSDKSVIFYDEFQSIKPSDVDKQRFHELQARPSTRVEHLKSQFRVQGGAPYMEFVHDVFSDRNPRNPKHFQSSRYDVRLYNDVARMVHDIQKADAKDGLSRTVAGFAWEWVSKKDKAYYDIVIGDTKLRWNSTAIDWVNALNAIHEVGCIHTTQGYDLNYTGVIIGPELDYDFETRSFVIYKDRYKDKNGKNSIRDIEVLKDYILNIYRTILFRGIRGTYIYACNDNLRAYLSQYIQSVPNVEEEAVLASVFVISDERSAHAIPFYDLRIAAGNFSELQHSETLQYLQVEERFYEPDRYFACRVVGESMNQIIPNGSVCLFERYQGGSRNGLICLVESLNFVDADLGGHYTIKEYTSKKTITEDGWKHQEITLLPRSDDPSYLPIFLRDEEAIDLKVIGVFVKVLGFA